MNGLPLLPSSLATASGPLIRRLGQGFERGLVLLPARVVQRQALEAGEAERQRAKGDADQEDLCTAFSAGCFQVKKRVRHGRPVDLARPQDAVREARLVGRIGQVLGLQADAMQPGMLRRQARTRRRTAGRAGRW